MSLNEFSRRPLAASVEELRSSWGWFLTLGILFIILGVICVAGDITATFATVLAFGWLLLFSGIFALIHGFRTHTWSGFLLSLLSALFRGFTGYLLIRYPAAGAVTFTLILASFFIVGGFFRAIGAWTLQFPRWGWSVLSGIVSVALGIMLMAQLPLSSIWFIGFAIGIDLIVDGASLIGLATAIHSVPQPAAYKAA
ncbi:MAG TPA: HdeD family acid-resistance protein [Candidatus Angelobacter sp.]|nr:HdeD family acid-resistance protein [Candidatus Angelobacter sp.]